MAYFPNGASGEIYQAKHCEKCRNFRVRDDSGVESCPIWDVHFFYSYEACNNETARNVLDMLIPEKGIQPQECSMFEPKEVPDADR